MSSFQRMIASTTLFSWTSNLKHTLPGRTCLLSDMVSAVTTSGTNCIKIGLPGKLILSKRIANRSSRRPILMKIVAENQFSGKTYFYTIASSSTNEIIIVGGVRTAVNSSCKETRRKEVDILNLDSGTIRQGDSLPFYTLKSFHI